MIFADNYNNEVGEKISTKESALRGVKLGDFKHTLRERLVEGKKVKSIHNTQRIHLSGSGAPKFTGGVDTYDLMRTADARNKDYLLGEIEKRKEFTGKIKGLIHNTNFSVGTHELSFDRKEVATTDDPDYEKVIVFPKPHKNISTLKIKYQDSTAFANDQPHSETMNINRVGFHTLAMTQRPRLLSHLKTSSIKFNGNQHKDTAMLRKM